MPQSNPQAEIHTILTDMSSPASHTPKRNMRAKNVWLITLILLVGAGIIVYAIIHASPKNPGLTEQEKLQILDYLEEESTPVTVTHEEKASIVEALQQRANAQ